MVTRTPLSFGALLKHLRKQARLTQEDLAGDAGYSVSYISMLERGKRTPQFSTVEVFAAALRLDDTDRAALLAACERAERREPAATSALPATPALRAAPDFMAPAPADLEAPRDLGAGVALYTILVASPRGGALPLASRAGPALAVPAERFAALARATLAACGGQVDAPETAVPTGLAGRPDTTVGTGVAVRAVFASASQAVRAALLLQARCAQQRQGDPGWAWQVGIGLDAQADPAALVDDAGVGVPARVLPELVADGSSGAADPATSSLAQRLCELAGPDEILASAAVGALAPVAAGAGYAERGRLRATELAPQVRVLQVVAPTPSATTATAAAPTAADASQTPQATTEASALPLPGMPLGGFLGTLPEGPLVARAVELERILGVLTAALGGAGQVVLLSGEPGVGKTRLAQEITRVARNRGMLVAAGRCYRPQQPVAYYPFLEVLATLYARAPAALRAQVSTRWPELGRLSPELETNSGAAVAPAGPEDQQRLLWQVTSFVQTLAEQRPIALLLDDLQWADQASLDLLLHLARQTRAARVFVLGIHRDSELPRQAPLQVALRELVHEHLVERVPVEHLPLAGTSALLAACLGLGAVTDEFAAHIHEPTEGNAFFVQEVVRTLIERGDLHQQDGAWRRREIDEIAVPESVRATIEERAGRLADATQTLLRAASVLGQVFSFDDLRHMEERDEDTVEAALAEATAAGLVREAGAEMYRFSHALTRRALAADLTARQRRRLHLAAGAAIEGQGERSRTQRPAELARHFLAGDAPERALRYLLLAGEQAEAVYAYAVAEQHYRSALEVAHGLGDLLHEAAAAEKLASILQALARADEAVMHVQQARTAYRELEDLEGQRRTCAVLANLYAWQPGFGGPAAGREVIAPLLEDARTSMPTPGIVELELVATRLASLEGRHTDALAAAERAVVAARDLADRRLLAQAQWHLAAMMMSLGRDDEVLSAIRGAAISLEQIGDLQALAVILSWAAEIHMRQGQLAACEDDLARACDLATRVGRPGTQIHIFTCLGQWGYFVGDWPRAQHYIEQMQLLLQRPALDPTFVLYWQRVIHCLLGPLALARGRTAEATALEAALTTTEVGSSTAPERAESLQIGHAALAERELLLGEVDAAVARLEQLLDQISQFPDAVASVQPLLAWAALQQGDVTRATTALERSLSDLRTTRRFLALVDALRIQALLAIQQRHWSLAQAALDEAIARARTMPYPYAEAKALYIYGLLHLAQGERSAAHASLNAALVILNRLGEHLYAGQVARVLAESSRNEHDPA